MNSNETEQASLEQLGINNCDKEQIQIPGSVQKFGALICFDEHQRINRCSENLGELLDLNISQLAGQDASIIFEVSDVAEIMKPQKLDWQFFRVYLRSGIHVDCLRHSHGAESYLDIVPVDPLRKPVDSLLVLREFVSLAHKAESERELSQILADTVRKISRIDRVKIYRFDADWNGEVIAESRDAAMPSYLGLHFPHTDIPKQARELYKRNKVRVIHDVNRAQSKLVDFSDNGPLDMSFSFVRSVSEIHLQYLRNMDVAASMSLSLFADRKFWGLVACHHRTPLSLTFEDAALFESLADIYSTRLTELKKYAVAERRLRSADAVQQLVKHISNNSSITELFEKPGAIHDMIRASGFVIALGGQIVKHGAVPDNPTIDRIVAWLEKGSEHTAAFDDFPDRFSRDMRSYASGLLAAKIESMPNSWIMWLRIEVTKEVKWAGDPYKPSEDTPFGARLYPRSSFEIWKETQEGRSVPWTESDLDGAESIADWLSRLAELGTLKALVN